MAEYHVIKPKTPRKPRFKLLWQTAASVGVFFMVLMVFQNDDPFSRQCQDVIRASFTTDADLTPVTKLFTDLSLDSQFSPDGEAIRVNAAFDKVKEEMAVPVAGKVVTTYGWQQNAPEQQFSEGVLIETDPDEEIRAAYAGTVIATEESEGIYTVAIAHTNGLVTTYGNCRDIYVHVDSPVEKGEIIGITANQETAKGNFYFAATYLGEPIDPLTLISSKTSDSL